METTDLDTCIRLAQEREPFDVPVQAVRLVGNRLELYLQGGRVLRLTLDESAKALAEQAVQSHELVKKIAPKPKPHPPVKSRYRRVPQHNPLSPVKRTPARGAEKEG